MQMTRRKGIQYQEDKRPSVFCLVSVILILEFFPYVGPMSQFRGFEDQTIVEKAQQVFKMP